MKKSNQSPFKPYLFAIVFGSFIGGAASFMQAIERITWGEQLAAPKQLACDLSGSFSCSSVFGAWQSSVFGFSNSLLCVAFFAVMLGFGLAALGADRLSKNARLVAQFFSLFFLAFGAWYISQTIFVVGSLCIYCIACYFGVILINWGWLRINAVDLPLKKSIRDGLQRSFSRGADTFLWILYSLLFAFLYYLKFSL
ncbi:hypothetical protein IPL68_04995 [Candidatus Saccharibacteria bacterium]|nr:MAG: hypothetical protein IPL68_04995 [Candidatus Saccharibacteria bacterium]